MPGICIGNGTIIGVKAVGFKEIPPYAVAVGNMTKKSDTFFLGKSNIFLAFIKNISEH